MLSEENIEILKGVVRNYNITGEFKNPDFEDIDNIVIAMENVAVAYETLIHNISLITESVGLEEDASIEEIAQAVSDSYYKGYIQKQNEAMQICKECKYREKSRKLEIEKADIIEKLEKRKNQNNQRYGQAIDNDEFPEMYEYKGQVREDDYILSILKGAKNVNS